MKILIADDSATLRDRLAKMFAGVSSLELVAEAHDVPTALCAVRTLRPDVVVLDIQMPGGSGVEVLREIKRDLPATIVIMLTNHPYPQYRHKCAELGADYFLCKSTDSKLLIEIGERLAKAKGFIDEYP